VSLAKRGCTVFSFEPVLSTFNQLKLNSEINNIKEKINLYNIGLGNKKEKKDISYDKSKHGEASLVFNSGSEKEEINIDTLDNLIKDNFEGKVIMKIDVEGFEYEVLEGAKKFIERNRPIIIIEIWNKKSEEFLKKLNYSQISEGIFTP
jgi:FkbM family methyltransferase